MKLDAILDHIYELPTYSRDLLKESIEEVILPKGTILLKADYIEPNIYLIKHGIVRAFSPYEKEDITFWFGEEGDAVLSMRSYVENEKGYENIELLEDCVLCQLNINYLNSLYNEDIHIANWGRKLAEKELLKTELRSIHRELLSATERYHKLLIKHPSLLQRVPLKHIASYLGITQVSLSRIRKTR